MLCGVKYLTFGIIICSVVATVRSLSSDDLLSYEDLEIPAGGAVVALRFCTLWDVVFHLYWVSEFNNLMS